MKLLDYISPLWFVLSLCFGIFLTYISTPPPNVVIKYPTPDNVDKNVYRDVTDTCYKYIKEEVNCDKNDIKKFDVNYVDNNKKNNNNLIDMIMEKL